MSTTDCIPAIEPQRVLILNTDQQNLLLSALDDAGGGGQREDDLYGLLTHGEEYVNETDELVRITIRKRRLEEEVRRINRRIADLEPVIVEDWAANVRSGDKHAPTGASLSLTRKVWAKLDVDVGSLDKHHADQVRADCKAQVAEALRDVGLGDMVRPDFNLQTLSAYFREQVKQHDAEQRDLPEHERKPLDLDALIPDELRGLLVLDATPHITVRAA